MDSATSDSLPSSGDLAAATALDDHQEFSSHHLFLPSPSFLHASPLPPTDPPPLPPPTTLPSPPAPSARGPGGKPPRKRPRASRRPPTTVLTTDTSNFRAMVQEFTGFPAPPFAAPPAIRPRLLGVPAAVGPPFLLRPSPLKFPPATPPTCTTPATTSSLADALALFAKSSMLPNAAAASGSNATEYQSFGGFSSMLGGLGGGGGPFDGFETAAAEGEKAGPGHRFFSSLGAGDRYDKH